MPTSTSRPPSVSSQSPAAPRPSFFSRIKTPFSAKTRNFTDPEIQLDDPHRQYNPGELVSGTVVLRVTKRIRVTHLVIALHGYAQVYKTPNAPGDTYRTAIQAATPGKGGRAVGYYGNGFATLFEDERVLCGDGMLAEGVYNFNFELEFPRKPLPSSIDFERGTITYMLTSTLTRNTTIAPTTTCERRIYFIEDIDIGPLYQPKPRVISLEPKSGRSKVRQARKIRQNTEGVSGDAEQGEAAGSSQVSATGQGKEEIEPPQSPVPSDISFETLPSSTSGSVSVRGATGSNGNSRSNSNGHSVGTLERKDGVAVREKKPITAKIELLKAGFLRGDNIPLKVTVSHTKPIKSMHGIIVTLYRQARVDLHPALPVICGKDGKTKNEDYFPRSKTGLGGLSLSNAGSTHLFRKDLAQSFTPLLVDPHTLTAEVKASIRVPDEAFPTITSVPGAMITFKYLVEVVVDLQGKLANIGRLLPDAGMMSVGPNGVAQDTTSSMFSIWGSNILDTQQLRREKSVVNCVFEVIVGTRDSERKKAAKANKGKAAVTAEVQSHGREAQVDAPVEPYYDEHAGYHEGYEYENGYPIEQHDHYYEQYPYNHPDQGYGDYVPPPESQFSPSFPLPAAASNGGVELTEKQRIQQAEMRLLPSQPPGFEAQESGSAVQSHIPSAPILPDEETRLAPPVGFPRPHASSTASYHSRAPSIPSSRSGAATTGQYVGPSAPPPDLLVNHSYHNGTSHAIPAPAYEPASSSLANTTAPTEDKQELERRRLHAERSAPPPPSESDSSPGPSAPSAPPRAGAVEHAHEHVATAPELHDLELDEGLSDLQLSFATNGGPSRLGEGSAQAAARGSLLPAYEPRRG